MESTIVLSESDESKLSHQTGPLIADGVNFDIIHDDGEVKMAARYIERVNGAISMVGLLYDKPTTQAHELHKTLTSRRGALLKPLKAAKDAVSKSVRAYERNVAEEAQRRRDVEVAKARAEAEAKQADEQARYDAEQKRLEDDRLEQAAVLEAQGRKEAAEAVIATPVMMEAPPVAPPVVNLPPEPVRQKPKGVSMRESWRFRITDSAIVPREWLCVDEKSLGQFVRVNKGKTSIPGVEVYVE